MSREPENFESLRKLLALKRHEQPPPGYFEQLPGEIRARLRTGEHQRVDRWRELGEEASWLQQLWAGLSAKPAWAGAFGMLVCGLVLTGIFHSQQAELPTEAAVPAMGGWKTEPHTGTLALSEPVVAKTDSSSTNPVLNAGPSLFDEIRVPDKSAAVNFSPGGK